MTNTERSLIGAMILDNAARIAALSALQPDDFADMFCRCAFTEMQRMAKEGQTIDIITLSATPEHLDLAALDACTQYSLPSQHPTYMDMILTASTRRKLAQAGQRIAALADDGAITSAAQLKGEAMSVLSAVSIPESKPSRFTDLYPLFIERLGREAKGEHVAAAWGVPSLDRHTGGMKPGELIVLAGRPGTGKSCLSLQTAVYNARRGRNVQMFNLEMADLELVQRIVQSETRARPDRLRSPEKMEPMDWEQVSSISNIIDMPLDIHDRIMSTAGIKLRVQQEQMRGNVSLVVVDYLQLVTVSGMGGAKLYEKVSEASRFFKMLAKELSVPVLLLSQLSRSNEHERRAPKLHDLRDSGSIEQDADVVLLMYDEAAGIAQDADTAPPTAEISLMIAKQRAGCAGIAVKLQFHKQQQQLVEIDTRGRVQAAERGE